MLKCVCGDPELIHVKFGRYRPCARVGCLCEDFDFGGAVSALPPVSPYDKWQTRETKNGQAYNKDDDGVWRIASLPQVPLRIPNDFGGSIFPPKDFDGSAVDGPTKVKADAHAKGYAAGYEAGFKMGRTDIAHPSAPTPVLVAPADTSRPTISDDELRAAARERRAKEALDRRAYELAHNVAPTLIETPCPPGGKCPQCLHPPCPNKEKSPK